MANKKISELTAATGQTTSWVLPICDPSTGITYKLTASQLNTLLGGGGDTTAPTIVSKTATTATNVQVVFSESVTVTTAGWSAKINGSAWSISSVSGSGTTWNFTMGSSATSTDTLLISYSSASGNTLDAANNELASVTDSSITNSISGDLPHTSPFTASNGTLLTAYTPTAGNGFTNVWGTMDIQSNRASVLTVGAGGTVAVTECGISNVTITLIGARSANASRKIYIIWRYEDDQNFMFLQLYDNVVDLYKLVSNSATLINSYTPSPSVGDLVDHTLVLTTGATNCALTIDGNAVFSGVANDAALTGTKAGFGATGVGLSAGDVTFDSFNVTA